MFWEESEGKKGKNSTGFQCFEKEKRKKRNGPRTEHAASFFVSFHSIPICSRVTTLVLYGPIAPRGSTSATAPKWSCLDC